VQLPAHDMLLFSRANELMVCSETLGHCLEPGVCKRCMPSRTRSDRWYQGSIIIRESRGVAVQSVSSWQQLAQHVEEETRVQQHMRACWQLPLLLVWRKHISAHVVVHICCAAAFSLSCYQI
jgi:hypothetical protein